MFRKQQQRNSQTSQSDAKQTTAAAEAAVIRVRPSVPYSEAARTPTSTGVEDIKAMCNRAREADHNGSTQVALRYYEHVAAQYGAAMADACLACPELAVSLVRSAELMEQGGGDAADRFQQAADIFAVVATTAHNAGRQDVARLASAEALEAKQKADKGRQQASAAKKQQGALLRQEQTMRDMQGENWARSLGRI